MVSCSSLETLKCSSVPSTVTIWRRILFWWTDNPADNQALVSRNSFTWTQCIIHSLLVIKHVSAHHMLHHQGVFVVVIIALTMFILCKCICCEYSQLSYCEPCDSFMVTTKKTPLCWHMWCAETWLRTANVRIIHFVHVQLILQTN